MTEKYEKIREIGRGSRATVFLVRNTDTDDLLAMKVYRTDGKKPAEAERELLVLKQMKRNGIPYLADCIRDENHICIFMEYIEGKSLRRLMEEKHILDEAYAVRIACGVAEILGAFHEKTPAWIYADLKPENIMISDKGEIYLVDFGSVLIGGERNHPVLGTKAYAPACEEEVIPYRDTYALGVILYEMLTGYTYADGMKSGKADISHLSKPCRELLQKAVKMRPEEAYPDAGEMKKDIRDWTDSLSGNCGKIKKKKKGGIFMKKERNRRNQRETYFIGDTKRFIRHGLLKYATELAVCALVIMMAAFAEDSLQKREIEAAENAGMHREEIVTEITEYDVYTEPIGNHAQNKVIVVRQLSHN